MSGSDVHRVAGELDSPLCEAPAERYRRALIRALESTNWRGFAKYFNIEVAVTSPGELMSYWARSHPNHKDHTVRRVFEYAEATQHDVLLGEFHEILRDFKSFIKALSEHISGDWKALAKALGFSRTDIDAIEYKNPSDLKEQIYEFFHKWKQQEGKNASIQKLVGGLMAEKLKEPLARLLPKVHSGECDKCPHCAQRISRSISEPPVYEQPKQEPVQRTSLSHVSVHIYHQYPQQNPSNQHHEISTVDILDCDSSTQPPISSLTPSTTTVSSSSTVSPPPSPCDVSSQTTSHEASEDTLKFPNGHPAIEPPGSSDSQQRNLKHRHPKMDHSPAVGPELMTKPDPPPAPLPNHKYVDAFLQRRFQTTPYNLFKYYAGHHRMIEVVGVIFLVFFVYQALASFLVTICEDCKFWNALPNGEEVYINILHRCLLFTLRISIRIIAPLCSLFQLHWIAVKSPITRLTRISSDGQEPFKKDSLAKFEGSLQRRIESMWITVLHAALFSLLLLSTGAFAGVEENITNAKVCNFTNSSIVANVFIQLSDCISVFVILLVMGLAKDCYCYENKIATHLLNFGDPWNKMCKKIRNRWLILDLYCYITSVGFTVFTGLSILAGKAFTPNPSQDLEIDDLVTWYFWISFLSLLLYLGFTTHRIVKRAGLVCYSLVLIFMLAGKLPIHVPPGSSIILLYITLGVSVFNLLVCLFCSRCRQKKSKEKFSRELFVLCLFCLLLLPVSGMAMLLREVIHYTHFVVQS